MKDRGAVTGDFNNYISPGIYGYDGGPSVLNAPGSVAGNLEVIVTTSYVIQRITVYDRTYTRRYNRTVWTDWASHLTNADILTKTVNLTQVTVPANSGTAGSTTNISAQIPAGYKLLDAREVGSGNNGCYVYFFNFDGVNITLQIRNITNAAITTTPVARLLLIPK